MALYQGLVAGLFGNLVSQASQGLQYSQISQFGWVGRPSLIGCLLLSGTWLTRTSNAFPGIQLSVS
jgi:hypothetical protein